MWHVTFNTWNMKWDTQHLTGGGEVNLFRKFQVPSFDGLKLMLQRLGRKGSVAEWIDEWTSNKVRTAPAKLGLLIIFS